VLNGTGYADRYVEIGGNDLSGLANLEVVRDVA
jgi:hypothetical protein